MSSSIKPKLKLEGKRTLLEQTLQWTTHQEIDRGKSSPYFKLLKMISVNKTFSAITRVKNFDIYRLISGNISLQTNHFYFSSKSYKVSNQHSISLSFSQFYNLIKFLKPSHIGTYFHDSSKLERMTKILQLTNGKIGLTVSSINPNIVEFLKAFASRIHEFECRAALLDKNEMFSFDTLDRLFVKEIESFGHIQRVLQYNIKSLELDIADKIILDGETPELSNTTMKRLSLYCGYQEYDAFKQFSGYLIDCCPHLLELNIDVIFVHEVRINQFSNIASEYFQYVQGLKDNLSRNAKISVVFKHNVYYSRQEYDRNVAKSEFGKINFDDWTKTEETYNEFRDKLHLESKKDGADFCIYLRISHPSV